MIIEHYNDVFCFSYFVSAIIDSESGWETE